jgi:tetratricopeptide (TPR) repeat protein
MLLLNKSHCSICLLRAVYCAAYLWAGYAAAAGAPPGDFASSPQQEYWAQVDQEDWSAAIRAAQTLVANARLDGAEQPLPLAEALSLLGRAQLRNADIAGAEASFAEALQIVERHQGNASSHTLGPLRGLGFSLAASGRHGEAIPYLDRALLISHRTHGLFHGEQLSILRQLSTSLTSNGEPLEAERHVNYMLRVGEHVYGKKDPDIVSLKCSVGDWHAQTGNFDFARRQYREAIDIVEKKLGKRDVTLVKPLRRLAWSYVYEFAFEANGYVDPRDDSPPTMQRRPRNPRYLETDGQRALQRALSVLEANPDAPAQLLVDTLIDSGDWFQVKHDADKALLHYRKAAQLLMASGSDTAEATQNPLAFPVRVYSPVPSVIVRSNRLAPRQSQEAYVQMELTVTAEGLVVEAKIVDESSSARQASEILSAIRDARFRPRFVDGEPVETTAMSFREVFRVRKRAEEEPS